MNKKLVIVLAVAAIATFATIAVLRSESSEIFRPFRGHQGDKNLTRIFENWRKQHNKTYGGPESSKRFGIFVDNLRRYEKINSVKRNFTVGLNQFSDLTRQEFSSIYLGLKVKKNVTTKPSGKPIAAKAVRADSVDWRTKNAVTPVKNQGQCGSCWAFSTTGSLEGLNALTNGNLLSFSEQQLVDCAGGSYGNEGCDGGEMSSALQYTADNGITLEGSYPYTAQDGNCTYNSSQQAYKNGGYQTPNSDSDLEAAANNQPVSVSVEADQDCFQGYTGGVMDDTSCGSNLDHGVLVVGYGTDASAGKYWIVKNSWGGSWGESGYIRIGRENGGNDGICGINLDNAYPTQ
jgi:C1A family cysteine protease